MGPKFPPHAVHLSEKKNDNIAVQYEDVRGTGGAFYAPQIFRSSAIPDDDIVTEGKSKQKIC